MHGQQNIKNVESLEHFEDWRFKSYNKRYIFYLTKETLRFSVFIMGINELKLFRSAVGMYVTRTDTYSSAKTQDSIMLQQSVHKTNIGL